MTHTTTSFYIGIIRQAVDEFAARFHGFGSVEVFASHIGADFTAQGFAQSADRQAIDMVERIAWRLEGEQRERFARQERIREDFADGRITEDVFLSTYYE